MYRLHVIGRKNNGKTTLIVELIQALAATGMRIGTIKHTHHQHELDVPGKDSHRHRQAGAVCVGILSPNLNAAFWTDATAPMGDARYDAFTDLQQACDLVIVEGDTQTAGDKLEVWRSGVGEPPLADRDSTILAIVSDDTPSVGCPVMPRKDLGEVIRWITTRVQTSSKKTD